MLRGMFKDMYYGYISSVEESDTGVSSYTNDHTMWRLHYKVVESQWAHNVI